MTLIIVVTEGSSDGSQASENCLILKEITNALLFTQMVGKKIEIKRSRVFNMKKWNPENVNKTEPQLHSLNYESVPIDLQLDSLLRRMLADFSKSGGIVERDSKNRLSV